MADRHFSKRSFVIVNMLLEYRPWIKGAALMHIHILGICGTFMGSLAVLARAQGHKVTGCDANVYPPMSTQLLAQGIELHEGYDAASLTPRPDLVIVGNAMRRGIEVVEALLDSTIPYVSGPQWLAENVLQGQHVLALSGTHGKTTASSMLAWVLADNGCAPGYLIGGVPANFSVSASLGAGEYFVIEADEYDSAFFDKRSKFVHYRPRTLVINNMEFDHADIFDDLAAIQKQFHHVVRTVPKSGAIFYSAGDKATLDTLALGVWSPVTAVGGDGVWQAQLIKADGSCFEVFTGDIAAGVVNWGQLGAHNVQNALMVIAAAQTVGISPAQAINSLCGFQGVKRRMELRGTVRGISVYDDFAHHPTAIATTLAGLRASVGAAPIVAVIEPRSNTMKMGVHDDSLAASAANADAVYWHVEEGSHLVAHLPEAHGVYHNVETLVDAIVSAAAAPSHIVVMSNGGFGGIHQQLLTRLAAR